MYEAFVRDLLLHLYYRYCVLHVLWNCAPKLLVIYVL